MLPINNVLYLQLFVFLFFVIVPIVWLTVLLLQGNATFSLFYKSKEDQKTIDVSNISTPLLEQSDAIKPLQPDRTIPNSSSSLSLLDLTDKSHAVPYLRGEQFSEQKKKEIELEAMKLVLAYEKAQGREAEDVSMYYAGYDIKSSGEIFRAIEVKGKSSNGKIFLTPNEWKTANELGENYFLYIVENLSNGVPKLKIIQNPARKLSASPSKIQYILSRSAYLSNADDIIQFK